MRGKMKLILMLSAICFMLALQPETVSAAGGSVSVKGINILSAGNNTVPCGNGTAVYDTATKTLTLNQALIDSGSASCGIEIGEPGVTIEVIGENTINAHYGILSEYPLTIKGTQNGGRLLINTSQSPSLAKFPCAGIRVRSGGLTIRDLDLQLAIGKMRDDSAYAIDSWGGDNLISNTKIKITMNSLANSDMQCIGINMPGADSLSVTDHSSITMESLDKGISLSGNLNISGSSVTIKESAMHGIVAAKTEISNGSVLNVTSNDGQAISAGGNKVTVSGSTVNLESTRTNGIFCQDLEITGSSAVAVKGYWSALFVENATVVKDSSVDAVTKNDVGIFCKGPTDISGSKVNAASDQDKNGIRVLGDLTIKESDITASGSPNSASIWAAGSISITGGTTEIGNGSISSEKDVYIGGLISSNGVPSFDNIANDKGDLTYLEADYSAVDEAVKKAGSFNKDDYTNFGAVEAALSAVVPGKPFWEQEMVDGYAAAIEAAIEGLIPVPSVSEITYKIIEGANQTVIKGKGSSVTIKSDGDFDKFVKVSIDNAEVAKEHYTAEAGSTVITLKAAYVETLAAGNHTVRIDHTDGFAQTVLTVQDEEEEKKPGGSGGQPSDQPDDGSKDDPSKASPAKRTSPKTGDGMPVIWLCAMMISFVIVRTLRRSGQGK